MWKAVFLAFACLLSMSTLLALMPGTGHRALPEAAVALPSAKSTLANDEADENALVVNTASKADKLSIAVSDDPALQKLAPKTLEVTQVPVDIPARPAPKAPEVTSWHWHVGSKIKRTVVRER
jgi:hypothetical protein